jgi:hypothetical protein
MYFILIVTIKGIVTLIANSHLHKLSSTQKMIANGTVVTNILHYENIIMLMLKTGIGIDYSHVITI